MTAQYAIYLRKSRADDEAEARGEEDTLSRHRKILLNLASMRKLTIARIYEEVVSGDTIATRPEMRQMLTDVQNGLWAGVLVMEVERLARGDTMDQGRVAQTFLYSETIIITPHKIYDPRNPADQEYFEFNLFMARRELSTITRRLQSGRRAAVKEGLYLGSRRPYGYNRCKLLGEKGFSLSVHPEEAAIVKLIFQWYVHGLDGKEVGCGLIAQHLNEMNIRTTQGKTWHEDRILKLIKNPLYISIVRWDQRKQKVIMLEGERKKIRVLNEAPLMAAARHEPIVDADIFEQAQALIGTRRKAPVGNDKNPANPFAGLVRCALCGETMRLQKNYAKPHQTIIACVTPKCPTSGIYVTVLEEQILDMMRQWQHQFQTVYPKPSQENSSHEHMLKVYKTEIATLNQQKSSLHDLLEQGVYDVDTYILRQREISKRLSEKEHALMYLKKATARPRNVAIYEILPRIAVFLDTYQTTISPGEKNALLKTVISKIIYRKTKKRVKTDPPAAHLTLDIYPAIPRKE